MNFVKRYSPYMILFTLLIIAPFVTDPFHLSLLSKFLCYAIIAVGLSLIWGYTGILSLGHGVFFGLGAYCMAMYLKIENSPSGIPDFLEWNGVTELPKIWVPFQAPIFAIIAVFVLPALVAFVIGYFTFRNRIKGVYFSLISQAVVVCIVTLFISQQKITGGSNGLTNFKTIFLYELTDPAMKQILYYVTLIVLGVIVLFSLILVNSRLGRLLIAIRDGENRVRFLGFNPTTIKVFVYCLSAFFAGLAGMLFVLQEGIISPDMMGIIPSIEMVLWVAIGGKNSIFGAIIGALITNSLKTFLSNTYPDFWLFLIGALFIIVVLLLPQGVVGLTQKLFVDKKRAKQPVVIESQKMTKSEGR